MSIGNSLIVGLTRSANLFVTNMKTKISQEGLPSVISDATSIEPAQATDIGGSIDIVIDLKKAPMARAFEVGSGIHSTRGNASKYPIVPVNASALAWSEDKWKSWSGVVPWGSPKFIGLAGQLPGGKFLFRKVEHPGVAPRPYIQPSIETSLPEIKKIIGEEAKLAIIAGIREAFPS